MKRIEAFIQSDKQQNVVDALSKLKIGGLTVSQSLGRGAGERPKIGGDKGEEIQHRTWTPPKPRRRFTRMRLSGKRQNAA